MQICQIDQQKAAWLESDLSVNCASYISTLLRIDIFACEITHLSLLPGDLFNAIINITE